MSESAAPERRDRAAPIEALPPGARTWRWPRRCLVCARWSGHAVCAACVAQHAAPMPRCRQCALALPGSGPWPDMRCPACRTEPPAFDHALAAAEYGFPWDRLLARLKFEQSPALAAPLGDRLAQRVWSAMHTADWPLATLVLPVPLAPARQTERGYNQAWLLAKQVARRCGLPADDRVLERWRDSPHQVGASRAQRWRNLADAFVIDPLRAQAVRGRHVALVDDVLTTGITAHVAAQCLRAAGASSVQVWVFARTPAPG